ncbi:hypothetical protein NQ317_001991 [Molorchus minor]|uniref:Uncharacterized protein n=1 Tax=Molorchus minor TaxID=1323400 RepID=A0ABQ9JIP4_9CUCU|nr:hypothetical protein NQ317_001991 [Molorchus minor]
MLDNLRQLVLSKFPKLIAFLKRTGISIIKYFVGLILGISGACRTDELVNLTVDDIEDISSSLIIPRIFVVTDVDICLNCFLRNTCPFVLPNSKHNVFCTTKQENVACSQLARIPWEKFLV